MGQFIGSALNERDAFCFLVLTKAKGNGLSKLPQVLACSVIRRRFLRLTQNNAIPVFDLEQGW